MHKRTISQKLISRVIEYYYDGFDADGFESFIKTIDESNLSGKDAVRIMEIRIIMGEYDKAYALLKNHSAMNIVPKRLMKMCSKKISCVEEEKRDLSRLHILLFHREPMTIIYLNILLHTIMEQRIRWLRYGKQQEKLKKIRLSLKNVFWHR